jgi:hypothetical protein
MRSYTLILKTVKMELEKFNGQSFEFAEVFTCRVDKGVVLIEQYSEGQFSLTHIKTEKQYIDLYEILTGNKF